MGKSGRSITAFVALCVALCGCQTYVGVAAHLDKEDAPEVTLESPIGIFGAQKKVGENYTVFCEHQSGIFQEESGIGLNECGIIRKFGGSD